MKVFSSKWRVLAAVVVILLLLFMLRPGASSLKSRIVSSISSAVGRPVEVGAVNLRLLPRPGFDLENLVVYDDPAYGAEPMLRASEVTAALRLTSLVRGRLEISRLDLTEPSLNLVHGENGRWNLEALLERTAHTPLAPTGKAKSEPRPGFPYIQATSARINFKSGLEKKPYALTNADFSLWQDSENTWGLRLKAQPFRSDLNLNDTGLLQVNGIWQRADALRDTPLQFNMEWNRAQLGQLSKFFTGNDQGWRGGIQLDVTLAGTPAKIRVVSNALIEDFRRYDITNGQALRMVAHCDGQYSSLDHVFHEVVCSAPVGNGQITARGDIGLPGSRNFGLMLNAENVPASAAVALIQRAKKNLPEDLVAGGILQGSLSIQESPSAGSKLRFEGRGEIAEFRLASVANKAEIGPESLPFVFASDNGSPISRKQGHSKNAQEAKFPDAPHVELGPFPVAIGRALTPTVRGWANRSGYSISIAGEADIAKTLRAGRMAGLPALLTAAEGVAQVDLQIAGSWSGPSSSGTASGFTGPQVTGTAKLRNARVAVRGASGPIEISSADVLLLPDAVRVSKLSAKAADTAWSGSLEMPRGCGTPSACRITFNLSAGQILLTDLSEWVNPHQKEQPWYRVLGSKAPAGPGFLQTLHASGRVSANRLQVQGLTATHVSTNVDLDTGRLQLSDLNADFLSGQHHGEWQIDFSGTAAVCSGAGSLIGISLSQMTDVTKNGWITGGSNTKYDVRGSCPSAFWTTAEGTVQFDVTSGALPRITLAEDSSPLQFTHLVGVARLRSGGIEIKDAKLESPSGKFQLSGTASLRRELDFKLAQSQKSGPGYSITGTLAQPRVVQVVNPETQARLKTEPAK